MNEAELGRWIEPEAGNAAEPDAREQEEEDVVMGEQVPLAAAAAVPATAVPKDESNDVREAYTDPFEGDRMAAAQPLREPPLVSQAQTKEVSLINLYGLDRGEVA